MKRVVVYAVMFSAGIAVAQQTPHELRLIDRQLLEACETAEGCAPKFSPFADEKSPADDPARMRRIGVLIDGGADVNAAWPDGISALMIAVQKNIACAVDTLIARGADIHQCDTAGNTALIHACRVLEENTPVIYLLLEKGAKADAQNSAGVTALMMAVRYGKTKAVETLIHFGANVDIRNKSGGTAMRIAKFYKHKEIIDMLKRQAAAE